MRFGSVCSGIEAASVAWKPLGWKAAWFAEIEPFPSAVLAHHYPDVTNYGDMTQLPESIVMGEVEAPDLFCGGTPCQAFSVAGLRKSLDDARGNLSLIFCEIANAIDSVRNARGEQPAIIFWENVPGVLSTKDNAFGCFLAGLAGEDDPLEPPGGKWTNAGAVLGPQRAVAWRVLDAQYFGVAQRRRRVFVVASARDGFDPAAVLFEFEGVRRDTAPSREAGEGIAGGTLRGTDGGSDVDHARAGHLQITMAPGQGGAETGFDRRPTLTCNHEAPIAAYVLDVKRDLAPNGSVQERQIASPLTATDYKDPQAVCVTGQVTHTLKAEGFDASEDGTGRGQPIVAFSCKDYGADAGELSPTLRSMGHDGSHANAGGQVAVAVTLRGREGGATAELGDEVGNCLRASGGGGDKAYVLAPVAVREISQTITSNYGKQVDSSDTALGPNVVFPTMQVRRLTPRECERLQGFPDDYTLIPWRKKPAEDCPDGPRYKALGNSWAVPNVRWIGWRIAAQVWGALA